MPRAPRTSGIRIKREDENDTPEPSTPDQTIEIEERAPRPYGGSIPPQHSRHEMRNHAGPARARSTPYTKSRPEARTVHPGFSNEAESPILIPYAPPPLSAVQIIKDIKQYLRRTFPYSSTAARLIHLSRHGEWMRISAKKTRDPCIIILNPTLKRQQADWEDPIPRQTCAKIIIELICHLKARERYEIEFPKCTNAEVDHTMFFKMSPQELRHMVTRLRIVESELIFDARRPVKQRTSRLREHAIARIELICRAFL